MKTLFIEAQKKSFKDEDIDSLNFNPLPNKIILAYSIQYKPLALKIKKKLEQSGRKILGFKQVLGCTELNSNSPVLLVGSGKFHVLNLLLQGNTVFYLEGNRIRKIGNQDKEILKIKAKRKAALLKFLSADKLGILVSCKPGQEQLSSALKLKKKLEKKNKEVFIFITDTVNLNELENFNIPFWVNTACPGLEYDFLSSNLNIINIRDLKEGL